MAQRRSRSGDGWVGQTGVDLGTSLYDWLGHVGVILGTSVAISVTIRKFRLTVSRGKHPLRPGVKITIA